MPKKHSKIEQVDGSNDKESDKSTIFTTIANIKKVTHPTTTPTPEPEPPDPHLYETQALQAQLLRILQSLGLTHI